MKAQIPSQQSHQRTEQVPTRVSNRELFRPAEVAAKVFNTILLVIMLFCLLAMIEDFLVGILGLGSAAGLWLFNNMLLVLINIARKVDNNY